MSLGVRFQKDFNSVKKIIKNKYNFLVDIKTSIEEYDKISRQLVFKLELDKLGEFIVKHRIPESYYKDLVIFGSNDEFKVFHILSAAKGSIFELLESKQKEYEIISLHDELNSKLVENKNVKNKLNKI